ncbi:hypothetical protein E2C01_051968 [Portunus trituberculatus]|uniref:Uncharacterized protein n=1 Tax=Portunus trituberculatus TaxID=210409 RepID=A0A5B7GL35_PORTR|nr:hypothetical protein [Portunus trituberculatus]
MRDEMNGEECKVVMGMMMAKVEEQQRVRDCGSGRVGTGLGGAGRGEVGRGGAGRCGAAEVGALRMATLASQIAGLPEIY